MTERQEHWQLELRGIVQGVGFRPFVYRLAQELRLGGWVQNSAVGVTVAIEGTPDQLSTFQHRLNQEKPPLAQFTIVAIHHLDLAHFQGFEIRPSQGSQERRAIVLPDLATCGACVGDMWDPHNRRYHYPFTNCTHCGPRHSILRDLPYDRPNTSMAGFRMCPDCQREYGDPNDRRFHAQPNACPVCGPRLIFCPSPHGDDRPQPESSSDPLTQAIQVLNQGKILAVKGIGGFHLMCDARHEAAVAQLRKRKGRPRKPLAIMAKDLTQIQHYCRISPQEAALLTSPQAPIVLLAQRTPPQLDPLAPSVAPGNPYVGVMLPYTPLHHLLLNSCSYPVVATSGNRSDEPLCIENGEALERLGDLADYFLLHDRPIVRPLDDSLVRVMAGEMMLLRRGRGYAPLPLDLPEDLQGDRTPIVLAVGGHLKNTIALTTEQQVFISAHGGDLTSVEAVQRLEETIAHGQHLYNLTPQIIAHDAHPDYTTSQLAQQVSTTQRISRITVQHHHAHVLACLGDNHLSPPCLGVAWDGTGYGLDGTIWGGEWFWVGGWHPDQIQRRGRLRPFPLLGGDRAARDPRRSALGLLQASFGEAVWHWDTCPPLLHCTPEERKIFQRMLGQSSPLPLTSSLGRLWDGLASLLNLAQVISFEGEAAMALEFQVDPQAPRIDPYPLPWCFEAPLAELDWRPLVRQVWQDYQDHVPLGTIAARIHYAFAEAVVTLAHRVAEPQVVLSGGAFQNRILLEATIEALRQGGFTPHWHHQVPPNDGGLSLGQALAARGSALGLSAQCP